MYLHNSLTNQKELFTPINSNIGMYVCGPTVYSSAHIGNARPVVAFDILYRRLRLEYENVVYVRNITDVDDKIILAAQKMGMADINEAVSILTNVTTQKYQKDMAALGTLQPTYQPKAPEHIIEMQNIIKILIDKGFAYVSDNHVLFEVSKLESRKFSISNSDHIVGSGHGKEVISKRNPEDFVLWKPSSSNQPGWESPWGFGRPGWHIECSAMSAKYLGETFDIHGGGHELMFPHHENEMAQSESAFSKPMANYWLHNGWVMMNGRKIAKSEGNFVTVGDLIEKGWNGEILRMALMSAHYRQPLNYTPELLEQSFAILDGWYNALRRYEFLFNKDVQYVKGWDEKKSSLDRNYIMNWGSRAINQKVLDAIDDDMNLPIAFAIISELVSTLNKRQNYELAQEIIDTVSFLGLFQLYPSEWLRKPQKPYAATLSAVEIEQLLISRFDAKKAKNYVESDQIREILKANNIAIEDYKDGTTFWKYV